MNEYSPLDDKDDKKTNNETKTAGIIVIGDEILKGHTKDANASFLLSKLWKIGVQVKKVSFVGDNAEEISSEVQTFSEHYDFVLTSGGIGPTHDDITLESIASAFDDHMVENKQLLDILHKLVAQENIALTPAVTRMARIPSSAKLIIGTDPITKKSAKYPLLNCRNVYVFPGVPSYLERSFELNQHLFCSNRFNFHLTKLYLTVHESDVSDTIEEVNDKFKEQVHIGSYPLLNDPYKVKVTFESEKESTLDECYRLLVEKLPADTVISVKKCRPNSRDGRFQVFRREEDGSLAAYTSLNAACKSSSRNQSPVTHCSTVSLVELENQLAGDVSSDLSSALKSAWGVFKQVVESYKLDQICIAFNGGKDCTVVLHLWVAFLRKYFPDRRDTIGAFYLQASDPFPEALNFIEFCKSSYNLDLIVIPGSVKQGLAQLKKSHPHIRATIMGTRRLDPYSAHLKAFSLTDPDWPEFMRVFPILDWSYTEVWKFLRFFNLPYCKLYNDGYTSLGSAANTKKNDKLKLPDGSYSPAYILEDQSEERTGRE